MNWEHGHEPRALFSLNAARIEADWQATSRIPPLTMKWEMEVDAAGLVWVVQDDNYPGFSSALADSLGSLSPSGEEPRLSTCWVDRALTWLDASADEDSPTDVGSGNATLLQRAGATVRAVALYDTFETEELPVEEVTYGLLRWRRAILNRIEHAGDGVMTNSVGAVTGMRPPVH